MLDLDAIRKRTERYYKGELSDDVIALVAELTAAREVVQAAKQISAGAAQEFEARRQLDALDKALAAYEAATGGKP
jgi:hypothetical protein